MEPKFGAPFSVQIPTRVEFGWGIAQSAGNLTREFGSHFLVVTQEQLLSLAWMEAIRQSLEDAGATVHIHADVSPEADAESIDAAGRSLKRDAFDLLIAVGGGSVLDFTKALSVRLAGDAPIWDYVSTSTKPPRPISGPLTPVVAIPTTSGTGSEVTPYAVLSNRGLNAKATILSAQLIPKAALVDPSLTLSLPKGVTAYTAADALAHAVESLLNFPNRSPFSTMLCEEAIRSAVGAMAKLAVKPTDAHARAEMAWASLLGGASISLAGTGLGHAMAEILGGRTHVPHGLTVAVFLPAVLQLLEEHRRQSLDELRRLLGDTQTPAHVQIRQLWSQIDLPLQLEDLDITEGLRDEVRRVTLTDAQWAMSPNPVQLGASDVDQVLDYVWSDSAR